MPVKLKEFPGLLHLQEYNAIVDKFLASSFDGNIWEFSDQEIQDLRVRLKLRPARTRATINSWFISVVQKSAERAEIGVTVKKTPNGVALQAIDIGERSV